LTDPVRSRVQLLAGAIMISFSPVLVTVASRGVGPTPIAFWRTLIGGLILLLICFAAGKPLRLPRAAFLWSLFAGFIFSADLFCWHRSIIYVGAGMATILGNTQVFATAIMSRWVFNERLSVKFALSAVAAFAGLILLVGIGSDEVEFSTRYLMGVILGLVTGLAYSGYIIGLKKGTLRAGKSLLIPFMAWTSLFSALFLGIASAIEGGPVMPPDWAAAGSLIAYGLVVQVMAWLVITRALPHVPAAHAGLILLLQPTLATVWGVIFFDEQLTTLQLTGACITLVGMYFGGFSGKRRSQ